MLKIYNELLRINLLLEPPFCVVSSWLLKRVYTILISNTISGSSNLDIYLYHYWILILILHLKVLLNLNLLLLLLLLLLFVIYIVHLPVVRPRSCRVIYYFDTHALRIRHQSFDHVINITKILVYPNIIQQTKKKHLC